MSRSAGPGSPAHFWCSACRRRIGWRIAKRTGRNVLRTGRTKSHRSKWGSARGVRSLGESHEYECQDCGHVGWSAHREILTKALKP
jgi:hypothetical protein